MLSLHFVNAECFYNFLQGSLSTCQLSEPLLWFILRVLDTSEALKAFHDMGMPALTLSEDVIFELVCMF